MQDIGIRLGILVLICVVVWLLIQVSRRFIEAQRQQALAATPYLHPGLERIGDHQQSEASQVRILAFSSEDCRQCHQLQAPALQRVLEARGSTVSVIDVDATTEHDLVQTYHVMTVPSTVILDAAGHAQAINYGFAHTQRLLTQIDKVLTQK
ncbi:thioredoxin family protein [Tengunoibacter tsumagoiensis]|uniref:Thiol reductase thioredoxin n=1 Tax=Tengunoibacter tsumagoiensis TaxID=2014871 RepID=A0A401ZYP2_9CHLR|nr:thioredoxin family protein [Tengunoibacter tsumagoiensis]GCE11974.1 thiol reductase thioredoxin [Tengunoibacter tsumagoiensis]